MKQTAYYGVFVPSDGKWSVEFPDLPGLLPWADTLEEAFADAIEALDLHLEALASDGDPIPAPSSRREALDNFTAACKARGQKVPEGAELQLVPAPEISEQQMRVNVSFKRYTLDMIDRKADAAGMTRSGFLAAAARDYEVRQG